MSLLGGIAGAVVGGVVIRVASAAIGWKMGIDPIAFDREPHGERAHGIGFGFFPARQAARMDPIDALRHE